MIIIMRKRFLLILIIGFFSAYLFASYSGFNDITGMRFKSMGGISIADNGSSASVYSNPALLYYRNQDSSFITAISFQDDINTGTNVNGCFLQEPVSGGNIMFASRNMSLGMETELNLLSKNTETAGITTFKALNITKLNINFALGNDIIAGGIGLFGGSSKQRLNIPLKENSIVTDYIEQTILSEYDSINGSEFVGAGYGVVLNLNNIRIGVSGYEKATSENDSFKFDILELFKYSSFGISYSSSSYDSNGRLKNLSFFCGLDFREAFSDTREVCAGGEIVFQLSQEYKIYFRTGITLPYEETVEQFSSYSFGFGARINAADINFLAILPFDYNSYGIPHYGISALFRL